MATREMPIFTRTFDLLTWFLPATNHFPRSHRHTVTRRLIDSAFDLREHLLDAADQRDSPQVDQPCISRQYPRPATGRPG